MASAPPCCHNMRTEKIFECRCCGDCCRGEGGIYIQVDEARAPAQLLGLTAEQFIERYTEPKYGQLSLKTDQDGYCLLHDREKHFCRIHQAKPPMCSDWPFFSTMLDDKDGFEEAKAACPGIPKDLTWEDFVAYHKKHIGKRPPDSYIFEKTENADR